MCPHGGENLAGGVTYFLRLLTLAYLLPSEGRALMLRVRVWMGGEGRGI